MEMLNNRLRLEIDFSWPYLNHGAVLHALDDQANIIIPKASAAPPHLCVCLMMYLEC